MNQFGIPVCSHPGCAANYCNEWDLSGRVRITTGQPDSIAVECLAALYDDDGEAGWDANGSPVEAE